MSVCVLMPAFNAAACIGRALGSVQAQNCAIDEVVVVDDGSTDSTAAVVEEWVTRLPVTLVRQPCNAGIAEALRRGVRAATAEWVFRLDADDRWEAGHVGAMRAALARTPGAVLVTASAWLVDEGGRRIRVHGCPHEADVRARLMWDNPFIHSATGFSRRAYAEAGGYPAGVRWEDYPLWIRLLEQGRLASVDEPTVEYTVSPNSLSRVRRQASIQARWVCQREAQRRFWHRHPSAALRCFTLGLGRAAVARWV